MEMRSLGMLMLFGLLGCATQGPLPPPGEVFAKVTLYVDT